MLRPEPIHDSDYARLLTVRTGLRRFERWSAEQAATHGLTTSQHQLLLAVRGHHDPHGPTIGEAADYLLIRHHSAVELVDRTEKAGLILRTRDAEDRRAVRLRLSPRGTRLLAALSSAHLEEIARLTPLFESFLDTLAER
jgi:DNA-binding MarR family transcriptional regulator